MVSKYVWHNGGMQHFTSEPAPCPFFLSWFRTCGLRTSSYAYIVNSKSKFKVNSEYTTGQDARIPISKVWYGMHNGGPRPALLVNLRPVLSF